MICSDVVVCCLAVIAAIMIICISYTRFHQPYNRCRRSYGSLGGSVPSDTDLQSDISRHGAVSKHTLTITLPPKTYVLLDTFVIDNVLLSNLRGQYKASQVTSFVISGTVDDGKTMTKLKLSPSAGTVPVVLILPERDLCKHAAILSNWPDAPQFPSGNADLLLTKLVIEGNDDSSGIGYDDLAYVPSRMDCLSEYARKCLDCSHGSPIPCGNIDSCREHSTDVGVYGLLGIDLPESCTLCSGDAQASPGGTPQTCPCGPPVTTKPCPSAKDISQQFMLNASAVTLANCGNVTLDNCDISLGRSAGVSPFFGCENITIQHCTISQNRFDAIGPDMVRSMSVVDCVLDTRALGNTGNCQYGGASISVSSGANDYFWFDYGTINIERCRKSCASDADPMFLYVNSPNTYIIKDRRRHPANNKRTSQSEFHELFIWSSESSVYIVRC